MKTDQRQKLLIIDGNNSAYRSLAYGDLQTDTGVQTSVLFSMLQTLMAGLKDFETTYFIITWDSKSYRRVKLYEGYKANRKEKYQEPEEKLKMEMFFKQMNRAKRVFDFFQFPQLIINGFEADDTISLLANIFKKKYDVVIVTTDKDMLQCLDENIYVYSPIKKILYNKKNFHRQMGCNLTPESFFFTKVLMGDRSDNIPGVDGVGEKTARDLVLKLKSYDFNSLKELVQTNGYSKKKISEKVLRSEVIVERNLKLMKLPKRIKDLEDERERQLFSSAILNQTFLKRIFNLRRVDRKVFTSLFLRLQFFQFLKNKEKNLKLLNMELI